MCEYLVWRSVADGDTVDLQYSVTTVHRGKQVGTEDS